MSVPGHGGAHVNTEEETWVDGVRASVPIVIPTAAVGVTFRLLAGPSWARQRLW